MTRSLRLPGEVQDGIYKGFIVRGDGTVAQAATVHVWNRYFSFELKRLFLPGFHGNRPQSTK
jgi:hypothetical protein